MEKEVICGIKNYGDMLGENLKQEAISIGLCEEHQLAWDYYDPISLIEYYKVNPNWSMERSFPSIDTFEEYFNNEHIRDKGVFISQKLDNFICDKQVYIFNNCTGSIKVVFNLKDRIFPMIYLGHGSKLKITIEDSHTPIYLFDSTECIISIKGDGKAKIYRYNNNYITYTDQDLNNKKITIKDR